MIENMILTEAVVTCTFAAIAELKIGIVRIRSPADSALMMVALLLGLPLPALQPIRRDILSLPLFLSR